MGRQNYARTVHQGEFEAALCYSALILSGSIRAASELAASLSSAFGRRSLVDPSEAQLLGAGESDTIEFVAPAEGTYKFICTWPAHYASMQGEMVVVAKK